MTALLAAIDWPAVATVAAWLALGAVAIRLAALGAIALWHALRAALRGVRTLGRVTLAKRGVRA